MRNALMISENDAFTKEFLTRDFARGATLATVATYDPTAFETVPFALPYMMIDDFATEERLSYPRLYLSSIELKDSVIDAVIERVLGHGAKLIVRAAADLDEVGRCDAKFNLSPIMLLHKLGLLDGATVAGGIYLDNDDVDLMVQCDASLVIMPSYDIGGGRGIPNLVAYLDRGLKVGIGCGKRTFDRGYGLEAEAYLLAAAVNGYMVKPDAVTEATLKRLLS